MERVDLPYKLADLTMGSTALLLFLMNLPV